ncbi:MAG: alpha/beta fold hydrolase [Rhodospirillales bacterium]
MNDSDLREGYAETNGLLTHFVEAGPPAGPPVVLLHGWPQTWYEWHAVMPLLTAAGYRLIAPDLRGLGDSERAAGGYDKRSVADDLWQLLSGHLGIERFRLVGHDWGGPTAFALAAAHPEAVSAFVLIDVVVPGVGEDFSQGGKRWHHAFHRTLDLPEALVTGREEIYLGWFYREFAYRPDAVGGAALAEYLRCYRQPGALRAGFEYYRALPQDAADNAAWLAQGGRLAMPCLGIGGAKARGRGREPEESLRCVASDVRGAVIDDCGHFVPEEQPELLARHLLDFFATA